MYPANINVPPLAQKYGFTIQAMQILLTLQDPNGLDALIYLNDKVPLPLLDEPVAYAISQLGATYIREAPASTMPLYWPTVRLLVMAGQVNNVAALETLLFLALADKFIEPGPLQALVNFIMDNIVIEAEFTPVQLLDWYDNIFSVQTWQWSDPESLAWGQAVLGAVSVYISTHT